MNEDFYIGYETTVPKGARARVFGAARTALVVVVMTGLALATTQSPLPAASFAFGSEVAHAGVVRIDPYPALETASGRILLVAPGKHGAEALVRAFENRQVRLLGAPIERSDLRLVEIVPGSVSTVESASVIEQPAGAPALQDFGEAELAGEIVDGKCFGGVMNPGVGTAHRDCARACLRGALPPLFAVRTTSGRELLFELQSATGGAVTREVAPMAGQPVTLAGRVWRRKEGGWILRIAG